MEKTSVLTKLKAKTLAKVIQEGPWCAMRAEKQPCTESFPGVKDALGRDRLVFMSMSGVFETGSRKQSMKTRTTVIPKKTLIKVATQTASHAYLLFLKR